jgi:pimeloyl-ACP methyl ester carboxylesterase
VPKIKCPTLVICGENSKTFLPAVAKKLEKSLPQVALKKMPNTGHFIPMEKPEELAGIVMEFVEKQK